ncbi:recombinase family protein [Mesorhizobium sp. M0991]|uniref:recombinase family protein n=1 Tax=Mesorhizobium sp. M0991 TaxID=2957043 RepID=UPI003338B6C5
MSNQQKLRCAVYTRKSTEEGLEQEFNSLDAQREACVAFIASQIGLGWKLVPDFYDDGGISGGTMERPALKRLLQDIRDKRIDVVVVYKIDRLTRSLMDFSKIVETFDAHGVSFVSVTQQFNTTTSMGRLTLNVLLSFAQFEREVTAERIRDKIAASRKKGIWMGGTIPLGYRAVHKKLIVDQTAAATIRSLFKRYLELKSVLALADELNLSQTVEGNPLQYPISRGRLYHLLSNPVYIGQSRHKDTCYEGAHERIVDAELFASVQALLKEQGPKRRSRSNAADLHLLTGLVFDDTGDRLSSAYANNHGKRYRYYISNRLKVARRKEDSGWRVPTDELEAMVDQQVIALLNDKSRLAEWIEQYASRDKIASGLSEADGLLSDSPGCKAKRRSIVRTAITRITLWPETIDLAINPAALVSVILDPQGDGQSDATRSQRPVSAAETHKITVTCKIQRRGNEARLIIGDQPKRDQTPDPSLVNLLARSHSMLSALTNGSARSISELSKVTGIHRADLSKALPLAFLAPGIVDGILSGIQPVNLTARRLARLVDLPVDWNEQESALGF